MKKILAVMIIAATALSLGVTSVPAEAKRVGGGSSIGKQSSNVSRSAPAAQPAQPARPAAAPQPNPANAPAAAPKPSMWKGVVGGLLAGAALGALFSHFGMGAGLAGALGSILTFALIALAAVFLWRLFARRNGAQSQPALQPAGAPFAYAAPQDVTPQPMALNGGAAATDANWNIPADFDVQGFLRHAKTYFIRLQAASDRADLNDLREFTTPEMFAELKMQITERGNAASVTDVLSVDATLLGIENLGAQYMASVRYAGTIREDGGPTEGFVEVWNLVKPTSGAGGWVLAGIQQVN